MKNEVLKPCPFCGGKAKYCRIDDEQHTHYKGEYIECTKCHASTSVLFPTMDDVKELVVEKWNSRV